MNLIRLVMFSYQSPHYNSEGQEGDMCLTLIYTSSVPPIRAAMDFLYSHRKIGQDDSQAVAAFKEKRGSTVDETDA